MSDDPRAALAAFVTALERHFEAASSRRGENDPSVVATYRDLADAFEVYDDALLDAFGEVTPLQLYDGDYDDDDDSDDDESDQDSDDTDSDDELDDDVDDDDDGEYSGFGDDDYDTDD